jgi:hypothetical protein
VLAALRSGGDRMAQFSHADFGGMSQWSPGMSMVGDTSTSVRMCCSASLGIIAASSLCIPNATICQPSNPYQRRVVPCAAFGFHEQQRARPLCYCRWPRCASRVRTQPHDAVSAFAGRVN